MELTKKDVRHIEDEVRNIKIRVDVEASEYARLYKLHYLQRLKQQIDAEIENTSYCAERAI